MKAFVKPKNGRIIREPRSHAPLPGEGKEVTLNSFWSRRISGGDVELANRKKAIKAAKVEKDPESEMSPDLSDE